MEVKISDIQVALQPLGLEIVTKKYIDRLKEDFVLIEYGSYDEYRDIQKKYNVEKINKVWADAPTLDLIIKRVLQEFPARKISALCHGTRNGFEQNYFAEKLDVEILGTDISDTAKNFPRSIQWDFHDENPNWLEKHDFIYTNSFDQSWKPQIAATTWLNQLREGGLLIIEHTNDHTPTSASEMDPFGVKPAYMPYLFCQWFGHQISIEVIKSRKSNFSLDVWLFIVKKCISGRVV